MKIMQIESELSGAESHLDFCFLNNEDRSPFFVNNNQL